MSVKSQRYITPGMSKEIEKLIAAGNWKAARTLIRVALRKEPDSHWLLTRIGLTYYEEYKYGKALFYTERALQLAPNCPLALWDYAGALDMLGRTREAVYIYKRLVKRGIEDIAYGDCGEGLAWARGLVADCFYRLAKCYDELGRHKNSLDYYSRHLQLRGPGCRSIYSVSEVKARIKELRLQEGIG
jgi:tetratricopeptide (TPR) repeat protein